MSAKRSSSSSSLILPDSENVIGQVKGEIHREDEDLTREMRKGQKMNVVGGKNEMNEPTSHAKKIGQSQEEEIDRTRFLL